MTKPEILKLAERWNSKHEPEDFELLYKAFHPLIINIISKYRPGLQYKELAPKAFSSLLKAIKSYDPSKTKLSLYGWVYVVINGDIQRFSRVLLFPGVPEHKCSLERKP